MKRHALHDAEIDQLQRRIRLDRIALTLSIRATEQAFQEQIASPPMLVAATGVGFVLGRMVGRRTRARPGRAARSGGRAAVKALETLRTVLKFASSGPMLWLATFVSMRRAESDDSAPAAHSRQPSF